MPTKAEIQKAIVEMKAHAQDLVRREWLKKLHAYTRHDTLIYASAFLGSGAGKSVPQSVFNLQLQDMQGFMGVLKGLHGNSLDLILHSPGGTLQAAEQIVNYLRSKYNHIRVIIPQNAMSAATMLACACDEIVMGRQSAIGPIDPQLTFPRQGTMGTVPAQALLDEFERAKSEVATDARTAPIWLTKLQDYPPGIIQVAEDTLKLAREKVAAWLEKFMLRGVTDAHEQAEKIAYWLGDAHRHKAHGHPISFDEAQEHGLKVIRLEDDSKLQDLVLSVYHATIVTFEVTNCLRMVENHMGKGIFILGNSP